MTLQSAVLPRSGGDQYPLRQGERHDIAVVVVGVFADQVDPTRRSPDSRWLPVSPSPEGLDQCGGVVAHATHCSRARSHLTTSAPVRAHKVKGMMAAYAVRADAEAPLNALVVGEIEPPGVPSGLGAGAGKGCCSESPRHLVAAWRGPCGRPAPHDPWL